MNSSALASLAARMTSSRVAPSMGICAERRGIVRAASIEESGFKRNRPPAGGASRAPHSREDTMTTAHLTDTDVRVRDAVLRQLEWDPEVDASAIGVAAKGGTVTLTGYIGTYAGKLAAERAAKRVRGVRAVANDIDVWLKLERTDVDIASDVVHALQLFSTIPDGVQAAVHNGHVTLTGKVDWLFRSRQAEKAENVERDLLVQALERTHNNQTQAGALLGINRDQVRYRIDKFGLLRRAAA